MIAKTNTITRKNHKMGSVFQRYQGEQEGMKTEPVTPG